MKNYQNQNIQKNRKSQKPALGAGRKDPEVTD